MQRGQTAEPGEERDGGVMAEFTNSQIDQLGDRLKADPQSDGDLQMLDEYRRTFSEAYESVLQRIRRHSETPTGRMKSNRSIVEKIRRANIRLSRMQDIAGCRVVVGNVMAQDQLAATLESEFPAARIMDRRDKPSHGYRAVHIIAKVSRKLVEIQVRSTLQHLWAELSEKSSDVLDSAIKYGGGGKSWRNFLTSSSAAVACYEAFEVTHFKAEMLQKKALAAHEVFAKAFAHFLDQHRPEQVREVQAMRKQLEESARTNARLKENVEKQSIKLEGLRNFNANLLSTAISSLKRSKEQGP